MHTLPSCPRSLPSSNAENATQQVSSYQDSKAESSNSVFARGDSQTRENGDVKFAPFGTEPRVFGRNNSNQLDENQTNEMWKAGSALQVAPQKLAMLKEEINTAKTFQVSEVSSASNPASPRRKISVYCRSFDMAAVRDSHEDSQRSDLEARQSLSEMSDDSCAQIDEKIDKITADRNVTFRCPFNYRSTKNISDSSTDSTPTKSFGDSLPDDESPCKQSLGRTICLAPMRLKLPQEIEDDLNGTPVTSKCVVDSIESDVALLSSTNDSEREKNNVASVHSSATFIVDKCETEVKGNYSEI